MESLSFKHAPIRIGSDLNNLSFLVATNGNCSTTNTLTEVKSIGYYNSYPLQFPNGYITNNISFQYLIQNNDPIKSILELYKSGQFQDAIPYYIDIGGLTFSKCYLESFSLNISPSTVVSAQVNFTSYSPVSGQFGNYKLPLNTNIDANFLHGTKTNVSIEKQNLKSLGPYLASVLYIYDNVYILKSANNTLKEIFDPSIFEPYNDYINFFTDLSLSTSNASYFQDGVNWYYSDYNTIANDVVIPVDSIFYFILSSYKNIPVGSGAIIQYANESSNYFGLNYSIKMQHQPINTIGASYPKTIKFHGAVEELELTENLYRRILYTGDTKSITINTSEICCSSTNYSISIDRAQSVSVSASTQNNGVVTTLRKFTKYY